MLKGNKKNFMWYLTKKKLFEVLKKFSVSSIIFKNLDPAKEFRIESNALNFGFPVVLRK